MIQLSKDLYIANNDYNRTPKETKKRGSNNTEKDFASVLEAEDGFVNAKPEIAEDNPDVDVEDGTSADENKEKEKKVVSIEDFFNVNINSLLEAADENVEAVPAAGNEADEITVSDEGEEKLDTETIGLYMNLSVENESNVVSGINMNDAVVTEALPGISETLDISASQENPGQPVLDTEGDSAADVLNSLLGSNEKTNDNAAEALSAENADFSLKMAEAGAALEGQNLKNSVKSEAKEQKEFDAAITSDTEDGEETKGKVSVLAADADKVQTKSESKEADRPAKDNAGAGAEKNNTVKSANDDGLFDQDAGKSDNKRRDSDDSVKNFDKETRSAENNFDKLTSARPEFQDFLNKISEQRSASADSRPQQMNLVNKGPAAFTESVENVVRFIRSDNLTKATLVVEPPALGRVNIEITAAENGIETVLKVSSEQVKVLVQDQILQLKQNLAQIGVNLAEFSVDVQQDDGRQREQSFNNKSKRTRFGANEEEDSEAEKIETFRVDLRKGLLHWVA